jgi:hypothetical protein
VNEAAKLGNILRNKNLKPIFIPENQQVKNKKSPAFLRGF